MYPVTKAKRPSPYTGNVPEANEMEKETSSQNFAKGGMAKGKPAVMAIVAKLAKKPMSESSEMNEEMASEGPEMASGMQEAKMAAAEEVMGAMKSGDASAMASALENFIKCCGEMED
jgi:hypothetical protein